VDAARRMKVLVLHNRQLARGGADQVIDAEVAALVARGHTVSALWADNHEIESTGRLRAGVHAVWNLPLCRDLQRRIEGDRPDVVHVHTPFPVMSPAVFRTAHAAGIPTVTTVHGYRYSCPVGTLRRAGVPCHDCVGRQVKYPAVVNRCYKGGVAASVAVSSGLSLHHVLGTFSDCVDRYIALSPFSRRQLIADGIPSRRIVVKPNFVADPGPPHDDRADQVVYAGRLAPEKGIATLVEAWERYAGPLRLLVLGDGDLRPEVEALARRDPRVTVRGWVPPAEVTAAVAQSRALLFPSEWYEAMPLVVLEALAAGTPVVVSDLPNVRDLVQDGESGLHFRTGDPTSLGSALDRLARLDEVRLRRGARTRFELGHREGPVMDALEVVYRSVVAESAATAGRAVGATSQFDADRSSSVPVVGYDR